MKFREAFIPTMKEVPAEAEVASHRLLLRGGMIRKVAAGIYNILPLGLRGMRKVENIIREEMDRAGAREILMPMVQPAELWMESGRWNYYGSELLRFKDRGTRDFCLGPTHEEVVTDLVRKEVRSYRELPVILYQIQAKFRDEVRPRFGLMRAREFSMKDAYSFDVSREKAEESYWKMFDTYTRIFRRCGLKFIAVEAATGAIGGTLSHEFMVTADTGEDAILSCPECGYGANLEKAETIADEKGTSRAREGGVEMVHTPGMKRVEEVARFLGITPEEIVKTLVYRGEGGHMAVLVRGDREANESKIRSLLNIDTLDMATDQEIRELTGADPGFSGPMGIKIPVYADIELMGMRSAVAGANRDDYHLIGLRIPEDIRVEGFYDLRFATAGDTCARCKNGYYRETRGIETGQIFYLGTKYSERMKAAFADPEGRIRPFVMGCYGIGVGRTFSAAVEQNHDENGIIFPVTIAPFEAGIITVNPTSGGMMEASGALYEELKKGGVDVLWDERDVRPGIKFKDADLIGIPCQVVAGERLKEGNLEIKERRDGKRHIIRAEEAAKRVRRMVSAEKGRLNRV